MLSILQTDRCIRLVSRCLTDLMIAGFLFGSAAAGFAQDTASPQTTIAGDLFQFAPATPERILEAAIITRNLDRQDDSRRFIRRLLDQQLSDTELRALRQRVGAGPFLELSSDRKLLPEARELLLAVNAASKPQPLSPAELQELILALGTSGDAATQAAVTLIANGNDSAAALLAADVATPAGKVADQLLTRHARQLRHGLMAQLRVSDSASRLRILKLLAGTADPNIAPGLLRWQFDPESDAEVRTAAARAVEQLSRESLVGITAVRASELLAQRAVEFLKASSERFGQFRQAGIVEELMPDDLRSEMLNEATLCLTDAVALDASNSHASSLLLVAKSAATPPALSVAASVAAGQAVLELAAALQLALEIGEANAGIELLRALRASDFSATAPDVRDALGSALRLAVNSPDPRIRFLACDVAVNVAHSEISASAVKRTLTAIRDGSLKPEAVAIDSNNQSLRDLDVALEEAGFVVAPHQTGQDGFDAAVGQMSCELILIDAESAGWPLATTLANLRSDARTRNVPIVVIGPDRFAERVKRLAEIHPGVWFLTEPVGIETLEPKLESLLLPPHQLSPDDRAVMKKHHSASAN